MEQLRLQRIRVRGGRADEQRQLQQGMLRQFIGRRARRIHCQRLDAPAGDSRRTVLLVGILVISG